MNTEKFTPGEWAWYITDGGDGYPAIFSPKMEDDIANMCIVNHDTEQSLANTYLIAAAPEMYAKLKTVLALCEGNLLRKTRCDILGKEIEELLKKARGEE